MTLRETTILVTDSGLGGLSVLAGIAETLSRSSDYDRVNLVYFNAWPHQYKGYNHYPDRDSRAMVFHNALSAMAKFRPDHIYIACNTLSVIYPFTRFAAETDIPVTGIVEHGVDLVFRSLQDDPQASAVIFGTPTTAQENTHKTALVKKGIDPDRIVVQGCLNLAGKIERTPFGDEVAEMIDENTREAAARITHKGDKLYAALCCTHFGYKKEAFSNTLSLHGHTEVGILNPNDEMVTRACGSSTPGGSPEVTIRIFSRVTWEESRIDAYDRLLTPLSPRTVAALHAYTLDKTLFTPTLGLSVDSK